MINITRDNVRSLLLRDFYYIDSGEDFFDPFIKRKALVSYIVSFLEEKGINYKVNYETYPPPVLHIEYKNNLFEIELDTRYCRIGGLKIVKGDITDIPEELTKLKDEYNNRINERESL